MDIIRAVAIELGLEIELIPNSWENTMDALKMEKSTLFKV